ncbi:DUF4435 domain-containing protein [Epilithonimonas pallida]|uniref:DUF4435 domain-containing protein n=1 Tax=Epilithonimonas pallida TaxID=373671 RepID=A0ABY1R1H5_9FLAO|nr:DUF4435 domain-containing protein [Epilithonimonas pallida]SMP87503.1 Protein of unknown function [Epilithonimonas pallida]
MAERSTSSKSARSVLLEDFNEIDVYVEDTSVETKKLYTIILNKATNSKYSIESVLPLGNSKSVIDEWKKHKGINDGRKKVFIIDGDFYLINEDINEVINDDKISDLTGLYILPKYCIENFLIDESALISLIHDDDPIQNHSQISENLNFQEWVVENEEQLYNLFILYSIIIKFKLGIQNVQFGVGKLCTDSSGVVCKTKIQNRIDDLKSEITAKISINLEQEIKIRKEKLHLAENKLLKFVSGKDYLFPLLKSRIKSKHKFNPDQASFKIRLAKNCSFNEIQNVFDNIIS